MEISFASRKLQRCLQDEREMSRAYGSRVGALKRRLALLMAAECLADVPTTPPERLHQLKGKWEGYFAVDISRNWRLIFRSADDPPPLLPDGGLDLRRITAIVIVDIADYH